MHPCASPCPESGGPGSSMAGISSVSVFSRIWHVRSTCREQASRQGIEVRFGPIRYGHGVQDVLQLLPPLPGQDAREGEHDLVGLALGPLGDADERLRRIESKRISGQPQVGFKPDPALSRPLAGWRPGDLPAPGEFGGMRGAGIRYSGAVAERKCAGAPVLRQNGFGICASHSNNLAGSLPIVLIFTGRLPGREDCRGA